MLPTARTLAALRTQGHLAGVTERWNQHARIRQDLLGFIDIIAIRDNHIVAIQATSGSNASKRVDKILGECRDAATRWCGAGGLIEIWAWRKVKLFRGSKAVRWEVRIVPVEVTGEEVLT